MKFLMIDTETLSTRSDAALISIGAIVFDKNGLYEEFYENVNPSSCTKLGAHVSNYTVEFWKKQSKESVSRLQENQIDIREALVKFNEFYRNNKIEKVFSYGAAFDLPILSWIYDALDLKPAWNHKQFRCARTYLDDFGVEIDDFRMGTYHNALDDAKSQALALISLWKD